MRRFWQRAVLTLVLGCACVALAGRSGSAATLTASADRASVSVGETFSFVLSLAGGDSTQPPDLAGLSKDFDIIDRRRTSRTTTIDGKRTVVNEWALLLSPKRVGTFTIPALTLAGQSSAPVQIQVTPPPPTEQAEDRPVFLQVEVGNVAPYVQSEVPVTVRIYDSVGMRSGALSQLAADGATFTPEGEQQSYLKTVGKQRYRVIQQNYTMIPQRSGTIEIQPVRLRANVPGYDGGALPSEMARLLGRGSVPMPWLDGGMNRGRDITVHSDPVKVEVKTRPADASGWFLPARGVTLTSEWSSPPEKAHAGDTLTRTIRLAAIGASPNQLPPLPLPEVAGVRQYEEESRSESAQIKGEPGASMTKTVSVVLTRAGPVTLPSMEVGWWNTATSKQETTVLPAETFTVLPGAPLPVAEPGPVVTTDAAVPPGADARVLDASAPHDARGLLARAVQFFAQFLTLMRDQAMLAGAVLLAAAVGMALFLWARRRRAAPGAVKLRVGRLGTSPAAPAMSSTFRKPGVRTAASLAAAERELAAACKGNNPVAAHRAYLACSEGRDEARTQGMGEALRDLRRRLYAPTPAPWNGAAFLGAFKAEQRALRMPARRSRAARLAPLYPKAG